MTDEVQVPRREISPAILATRAAKQLVAPLSRKLGAWQATSIKLETMAKRLKASGRRDERVAAEARALLTFVEAQTQQFEASVAEAPEPIRTHGRVNDARMVLRLLEERIAATLTDLGEPPAGR